MDCGSPDAPGDAREHRGASGALNRDGDAVAGDAVGLDVEVPIVPAVGNGLQLGKWVERFGYFWRGGSLTTFGSLGGGGTVVADMNDQTAVVGTSLTSDGKPHVFVWKPGQSAPTDLGGGPPGAGVGAVAVAINTRGDIIGYTCANYSYGYCVLGGPSRAILWRVK